MQAIPGLDKTRYFQQLLAADKEMFHGRGTKIGRDGIFEAGLFCDWRLVLYKRVQSPGYA